MLGSKINWGDFTMYKCGKNKFWFDTNAEAFAFGIVLGIGVFHAICLGLMGIADLIYGGM